MMGGNLQLVLQQMTSNTEIMFQFCSIYTSAVWHSRPIIKKFPITLHISLPGFDQPTLHHFTPFDNITNFLKPKSFFMDPSGTAIHADQVEDINNVVYDMYSPGWTHHQKEGASG
jgi:hypothetical protein